MMMTMVSLLTEIVTYQHNLKVQHKNLTNRWHSYRELLSSQLWEVDETI
jgi:hypothetical protein